MNKKELKDIIAKLVLEETKKISMGNAYRHKEEIMQAIQTGLLAKINMIESQEEFYKEIENEAEKIKLDLEMTVEMVKKTLSSIPLEIFKQLKK